MQQSQEQQTPEPKGVFETHKTRMRKKLANLEKRNNLDDVTCFGNTRTPGNTVINPRESRMRETSVNPLYESTDSLV